MLSLIHILLVNEQEAATASAEQARKNANLFSLAALCLGVLISLVSILALRNAIMRPLNKLMSFASDCAGGNRDVYKRQADIREKCSVHVRADAAIPA